ncbi:class I SAM-dependent methyltransferase [Methylobacterium sp. SyP6R]|uniref:class I SAM-dependent methyltransferase n=1 Tax=Methylobacterium sp. SyP6R TaxID=2718876 RepID=UPI001F2F7FF6|nr:class I SAM-dependent methyltransferase [Methylobacterium sp. SyP6R]MCF4130218.1 class I SAM-dependent methyltransferase [Methylobacterium sp. SyP6R]
MDEKAAFDEAWYLTAYPDVATAVERGEILDGLTHFLRYGKSEGRSPSDPKACPPPPAAPSPAPTATTLYTTHELDVFVDAVDAAGGPESPEGQTLLNNFALSYDTPVDQHLDPYSDAYVAAQVALYQEISGRVLDQSTNELTQFDIDSHAAATNPYGWRDPSRLVLHHLRIGRALRLAGLPATPRVLDIGAGWGLTTEFLAMLGADVVALDINPDFVALINRRAVRLNLPITALVGTFETFQVDGRFDMVFFYEALHHAVRPWQVIARCADRLKTAGVIAFAAEPIQDAWWPHWGLRLDGVSVYCIRKFGWFESGWSEPFTHDMFRRVGLNLVLEPDAEAGGGTTGVARPLTSAVPAESLSDWLGVGWSRDETAFYSSGHAVLNLPCETPVTHLGLHVVNYRDRPLNVRVLDSTGTVQHIDTIPCGRSEMVLPAALGERQLTLNSDTWVPAEEFDTIDRRRISFYLEHISARHACNTV